MDRVAALSARTQTLCASLALVVCGYLFYAGVLEPHLLGLGATSARLQAEQRLLAEKRRAAADHTLEEQDLERLRERLAASDARFFSPGQAATFFANLHPLAEATHCQLTSIDFLGEKRIGNWQQNEKKPTTAPRGPEHGRTPPEGEAGRSRSLMKSAARLSLTGTYPNVIDFLQAAAQRPQAVDVRQLSLGLASRSTADLNVSLVVSVWWLEEEGTVR